MALSYVTYASDGVQVQYDIPFGYLRKQHVFAFVNDALRGFKWISNSRIELYVAPQTGDVLRFQRLTERASRIVDFTDGQTLLAGDLNAGDLQNFYVMQELIDQITDGLLLGDLTILNPNGGWITAAWIAEQLDASAPPAALSELADLITQEEQARAAAVTAEANARVTGLAAEANARVADLINEALARTQGLDAVDAAIIAEQSARTTADTAIATDLTAVTARTGDAEAAIIAEQSARTTADTAIATDLAAVVVRTGDAEAAIIAEQSARTTADTAIATDLAAIVVRTGDAEAAIIAEQSARTTADTAIATDLAAVLVRTGDAEAAIIAEQSARTTADTAIATDLAAVSTRTGNTEADVLSLNTAITTETNARAEAIDIVSASATTLSQRVGGVEDSLVKNSRFQQPFTGTVVPPEWTSWAHGPGQFVPRTIGSGYAFLLDGGAGLSSGVNQSIPDTQAGTMYLLAGEITLEGGTLTGAGMLLNWYDGAAGNVGWHRIYFETEAQTSGVISGSPVGVARWEKQVTAPAGAVSARIYAMNHWATLGSIATANSIAWREASLSPLSLAQAKATTNEANITSVEEALVTEALTRASSVESLAVVSRSRPVGGNLLSNPSLSDVTANRTTTGNAWAASGTFPDNEKNPNMPNGWLAYSTVSMPDAKQLTIFRPNGTVWLPSGVAGFMLVQMGSTPTGYAEIHSDNYPCSPGQRVGAAIRASIHRCTSNIYTFFYSATGAYLGVGTSSPATTGDLTSNNNTGPTSGAIANYAKLTRFSTAPPDTRYVRLVIRKNYTSSGSNSYLFASCPQLMFVDDDATDLPPYDGLGSIAGLTSKQVETNAASITTVSNAQVTDNTARASEISLLKASGFNRFPEDFTTFPEAWTSVLEGSAENAPTIASGWTLNSQQQPAAAQGTLKWLLSKALWRDVPGAKMSIRVRYVVTGCSNAIGTIAVSAFLRAQTLAHAYTAVPHFKSGYFEGNGVESTLELNGTGTGAYGWFRPGLYSATQSTSGTLTILSVEFGGPATSSVQEAKIALTDSSGNYSYYGLKINAGDNSVASIEAMSDTKTSLSKLKLKANKIEMEGQVIINGSLYTEQLALGAVSNVMVSQNAASVALSENGWKIAATAVFTSVGIGVEIRASCTLVNGGTVGGAGTSGKHEWLLRRVGVSDLRTSGGAQYPDSEVVVSGFVTATTKVVVDYNDLPTAGAWTYQLYVRATNTLGSPSRTVSAAYLSLKEFKR